MNRRAIAILVFYTVNTALVVHLVGGLLLWPGWVVFGVSCLLACAVGVVGALRGLSVVEGRGSK